MAPTVYDIRNNADSERFQLSTTQPGRWDPNRSARDYMLSRRIQNRDGATPQIIVLHIQQGSTPGSLGSWVNDQNDDHSPRAASATVTIQKDGSILRVIPEEHGPWTNGPLRHPTQRGQDIVAAFGSDPNAYTLSIEAEGQSDDEMQPEQLDAVVWQVGEWMRTYRIPLDRVVRHADFDMDTRKFCPGRYYDQVIARLVPPVDGFPFKEFDAPQTYHVPIDRRATGRTRPTRVAPQVMDFDPGTEVIVDGVYSGETVEGDNRWFRTSGPRHLAIHASGLAEGPSGKATHHALCSPPAWEALNAHNAEIARAAELKGVPANLLKSMINRESSGDWARDGSRLADVGRLKPDGSVNHILPFVGVFETTAASWGFDFNQMVGNKSLQIEVMATILAGLAAQYGGFDKAATVYFGGPDALNRVFCDEFGMCSDEYTSKAIRDWQTLDRVAC